MYNERLMSSQCALILGTLFTTEQLTLWSMIREWLSECWKENERADENWWSTLDGSSMINPIRTKRNENAKADVCCWSIRLRQITIWTTSYVYVHWLTGANDAQHQVVQLLSNSTVTLLLDIDVPFGRWQVLGLIEAELNCAKWSTVEITGKSQHVSIHL